MNPPIQPWRLAIALLALALPFLFGITKGPAANMLPLIFGLGCAGIFLLCSPQGQLQKGSDWALLALPVLLLVHGFWVSPSTGPLLAAVVLALLLFWGLAQAAAGWQQRGWAHWLWLGLLAAALLNSAICVLQYVGGDWLMALSPWIHPGNSVRTFGNLRQPNQMASLSAMGFAVLALYAPRYCSSPLGWQRVLRRSLALAALALLAFACASSRSRTGLLQWLGIWGCALFWLGRGRAGKGLLLWASLGLAFYGLFLWALAHSAEMAQAWQSISGAPSAAGQAAPSAGGGVLARMEAAGKDARTVLWSNMLQVAAQRPWLGWGWGNLGWGLINTPIQGAIFSTSVDNAHLLPLHLAVELGWPLTLLFCLAVAAWVYRRSPGRETQTARQAAWLVLAVIGLHSLLEYPLWHAPFWLTTALAFGLLAASSSSNTSTPAPAPAATPRWLPIMGVAACALSLTFCWDWLRTSQVYLKQQDRMALFTSSPDWIQANSRSRWFAPYADFAEQGMTPLDPENAAYELARAERLLHYWDDARLLRRARDAAQLLGRSDLAAHYQMLLARRWPRAAQAEAQARANKASAARPSSAVSNAASNTVSNAVGSASSNANAASSASSSTAHAGHAG